MQVVERTKQQSEPRLFIDAEVVLVVRKGAISLPPPPVEQSSPLRRRGLNSVVRGSAVYSQSIIPAEGTRAHTCAPVRMRSHCHEVVEVRPLDHGLPARPPLRERRCDQCSCSERVPADISGREPRRRRRHHLRAPTDRRYIIAKATRPHRATRGGGQLAAAASGTGRGYAVPHSQPRAR